MNINVKYSYSEFQQVGNLIAQMLNEISKPPYFLEVVENVAIIEALEQIVAKIVKQLKKPFQKNYSLPLNSLEVWAFMSIQDVFSCNGLEAVLLNQIVVASNMEASKLIRRREDLRANVEMLELRE